MRRLSLVCLLVAVVALAPAVAACADEPPELEPLPPQLATPADLVGPWRATPFLVDPALWVAIEQTCRREIELPPGSRAAIIDVRGAEVATVRMTGQVAGSCNALQVSRTGQVAGAGGGWSGAAAEELPRLGDAQIGSIDRGSIGGGDLKVQGWSVSGRVGAAIASIVIVPPGAPSVLATLRDGWFAAWWPGPPAADDRGPPPHPPVVIQGFDAAGLLVAELRG
ncbi:MAG TPA: hypothetical protein VFO78_11945 [Candidatus Limnocylindrales bacterium]|nr:hypothetical protein [Candidatus Limnocylindrales bacterium]